MSKCADGLKVKKFSLDCIYALNSSEFFMFSNTKYMYIYEDD